MIFRLTHKLSAKIKAGTLATLPLDENPVADWSASLFVAGRTQYVLLAHTKALYSTVLLGKGMTDNGLFIERALSGLREFMQDEGLELVYRRFIAPASASIQFAKALDRSVTGSMNDLIRMAKFYLTEGEQPPREVGVRLNGTPMSALGGDKPGGYGLPREAFRALVDTAEA